MKTLPVTPKAGGTNKKGPGLKLKGDMSASGPWAKKGGKKVSKKV